MFASPASSPKMGCVALVLALTGLPALAADALGASFDRMLAHEHGAVAAQLPSGAGPDPLLAAMVVPLRDGVRADFGRRASAAGAEYDTLAASFARMLAHEPSWAPPALPAGAGVDPLVQAVVRPLLRANLYTVAGVAPQPAR